MKTLFLSILFILVLASSAFAAPFLISDPYGPAPVIQPTYFNVIVDGGAAVQSLPETVTGGIRLHYDLVALTDGAHQLTVAACNEQGCSATVPFSFTKGIPTVPSTLKLSPN